MTAISVAGMPVGAAIHLAEAAQAIPRLVRSGTIGRAAAVALLAIASVEASSPDSICECSQAELAAMAGTGQSYIASSVLPQLEEAGLIIRCRHAGRDACLTNPERIRAAGWGDL